MFGLRSTTGLISRHGLNTFAPSFARVGVIAKDAADLPVALKALSGGDLRDAATAAVKEIQPGSASEISISNLKIGYPSAVFNLLSGGTAAALKAAIEEFKGLGVEIVEINLPHFSEALQSYYVIAAAEASSNFGRFDGIRFGAPHDGKDLEEWYSKTRSVTLGPEGKRRSVIGTYMLSKDSFERYYRHAQKVWALVKNEFHQALKNCDTIILPAASGPAELLSAAGSFIDAYTEDLFCAPVSLSGLPALTLPGGEVEAAPVGMQLVGQPFAEMALASIALHFASRIQLPPITVL